VGEFMDKRAELLGCSLTGKDGDSAPVTYPQSWCNALLELKPDALGRNEVEQPLPVLPDTASDALRQFGKVFTFGLADIEDVGRTEPDEYGLILGTDVLLGLCTLLPTNSDYRSKDADAALSFPDLPAKLIPCV
jgi:hypothetical protein